MSIARDITIKPSSLNLDDDELDQIQKSVEGLLDLGLIEGNNFKFAQSFIPQKNICTRIFLLAARIGIPYTFDLAIRKNLDGQNLTTISLDYTEFPYIDPLWVEFDFDDIPIIAGETYYFVISTKSKFGTIYSVGAHELNPYSRGSLWRSSDWSEWNEDISTDLCFKIYGKGGPPDNPEIDGPTNGKIGIAQDYNLSTSDPDEDMVSYYVDWGDGITSGWKGPYNSGTNITLSNAWSKEGTFEIKCKAKDSYGAESEWSYLEVTIPRNHATHHSSILMKFLNQFPLLKEVLLRLIR